MKIKHTLIALAFCTPFLANAENNFYIGLDYGFSSMDSDVSSVSGADLDEDDSGFKLYGGFSVNENIAIEVHYADFGEGSLSGNTGDQFVIDGDAYQFITDNAKIGIEPTSFGLSGIYKVPTTYKAYPYARLGVHRWDIEGKVSSNVGGAAFDYDGTDVLLGIGVQAAINEQIQIRGEYELFKADNNLDYISLGVVVAL